MSKAATTRRKRRRAKAKLANQRAVRRHARKGGRTGAIHAKRTRAKGRGYTRAWPNPPALIEGLGQ